MDAITPLYDRDGNSAAYIDDDGKTIYLYDGAAVAYVDFGDVFSCQGRHLGFSDNGWVRDLDGHAVLFHAKATALGPSKPVVNGPEPTAVKRIKPELSQPELPKLASFPSLQWSPLSVAAFFGR